MRKNYFMSVASRFFRCFGWATQSFSKSRISSFASLGELHQPIFIVNPPRTGSTILYQILTNTFDISYINNLICMCHKNLYLGFGVSNILFGQKPHNSFNSFHGRTDIYGLRFPSECADFWYRWLPMDKPFIGRGEISDENVKGIRENIFAIINRYDKPILFKNLNAGLRMGLISEVAPNAKFIYIKRDPLFVAQSIFAAREELGIGSDEWWSSKPRNFRELLSLNCHERIVKQIFFLEKQIMEDSSFFAEKNFITINYEDLCKHTEKTLSLLHSFIGYKVRKRKGGEKFNIKFSHKKYINNEDFERLKFEISKLHWQY